MTEPEISAEEMVARSTSGAAKTALIGLFGRAAGLLVTLLLTHFVSKAEYGNANLAMIPFLAEMKTIHDQLQHDPAWQNTEFDPPGVSWNIGINDHTPAINITPPQSVCTVYFRPMPGQDGKILIERARQAAERHGVEFKPGHSGQPLYVDPQSSFVQTVLKLAGKPAPRTVPYGTEASHFQAAGCSSVVIGPGHIAQAHQPNEFIEAVELDHCMAFLARVRDWAAV